MFPSIALSLFFHIFWVGGGWWVAGWWMVFWWLACLTQLFCCFVLWLGLGCDNIELRKKLGFHRISVMAQNMFKVDSYRWKQHMFSMSPSILAFNFIQFKSRFLAFFGTKKRLFLGLESGSNRFGFYSYSATTFFLYFHQFFFSNSNDVFQCFR